MVDSSIRFQKRESVGWDARESLSTSLVKRGFLSEMVGAVIRKVSCKDLIQELEQHGTVGIFTE